MQMLECGMNSFTHILYFTIHLGDTDAIAFNLYL